MTSKPGQKLGANISQDGGCNFLVWAPWVQTVCLHLLSPLNRFVPMHREENGYFHLHLSDVPSGALYLYQLDNGEERPDPASRFQPQGVHGPSEVVDSRFDWEDESWHGMELQNFVFYEIHTGTFTPEGTFEAIISRLAELKDLGISAVELMPVAQFPGSRNWGYDGVFPFAVQESYGGPQGLKRLVNACHRIGLAAVLDVVYNHLGPEGNYLGRFGPYFTDAYSTPWGEAINFDHSQSDQVRRYFIENALYWVNEFHFDALRLDAVHAITDMSARPFLRELAAAVHQEGERLHRNVYLIPESNQNDARLVASDSVCGFGLDALWNDDFHHALHVLLTGEHDGYYADFGTVSQLACAISEGFIYTGQYSQFRGMRHGNSSAAMAAEKFVVFIQNHDQVGNRRLGDRFAALVPFEALKLAAGFVILSPFLPLLFMGEEYGETAPFQYFVSHGDTGLIEAVRKGRRDEFSRFDWHGELPEPQDESTFLRSRLSWELRNTPPHSYLLALYKELLRLRREHPVLSSLDKNSLEVLAFEHPKLLLMRRWHASREIVALFHFGKEAALLKSPFPVGRWEKLLDSADPPWGGGVSPLAVDLESSGEVEISLLPWFFALFGKVPEA
ncbi:MAG: malto-oligosyltrehalose trehalohydrolase [Candidatus Acidiferrales bacterium]